jgi:hypothetical protein
MSEPSWTEAEIRAALNGHDSYASDDGDEGCCVHCDCDDWTGFHLEHVLDVLKASKARCGCGRTVDVLVIDGVRVYDSHDPDGIDWPGASWSPPCVGSFKPLGWRPTFNPA